MWAVDKRHG